MLHQVLKKFKAEGRMLERGEIVETSHWKNERLLLEHRFIGKPSAPEKDKEQVKSGNRIVKNEREPLPTSREVSKLSVSPKPPVLSERPGGKDVGDVPAVGRVPVAKKG